MPSWRPSAGWRRARPAVTGRTPSRDHPDAPRAEGTRHRFVGMLPLTGSTASPRSATASAGLAAGHSETPRNLACQKHRRSGGVWFPVVISQASRRDRPAQRKGSPKGGSGGSWRIRRTSARSGRRRSSGPRRGARWQSATPHALRLRAQAGCGPAAHTGGTRGSCRTAVHRRTGDHAYLITDEAARRHAPQQARVAGSR